MIVAGAIELELGADATQVKQFSSGLHSGLAMCLNGGPLHTLWSVAQGKVLGLLRMIMGGYRPRIAQSDWVYLMATIATSQAKRVDELDCTLFLM